MLLIITNSNDATADFLEPKLARAGLLHYRLNTDEVCASFPLSLRLCSIRGEFLSNGTMLPDPQSVSHVWLRRPVPPQLPDSEDTGRNGWMSAEIGSYWAGYFSALTNAQWMNSPVANELASSKINQLLRAPSFGLSIPDTLITADPDAARSFFKLHSGRVIAKPLSHGHLRREKPGSDSYIYTNRVGNEDLSLIDRVAFCPTFFQQEIRKLADLRITIVGDQLFCVKLLSQAQEYSQVDCRRNNMEGMQYEAHELDDELRSSILSLVRSYGLVFAAVDMILSDNASCIFLEINPNGQWAWMEEAKGFPL